MLIRRLLSSYVHASASSAADVVVVGGGAAGVFCAGRIKELAPDKNIVLLEATSKLLRKVKISGGGRCNVTHDNTKFRSLLDLLGGCYPRGEKQLRGSFSRFGLAETQEWFGDYLCATGTYVRTQSFDSPSANASQSL